ncbi:hypothetical protein [Streptomyces sp. NPDC056663]|uniref:hypothetical protein n=1 Tax=Streptomyces sp. NPDC056663 TaxID=3345899 RepID=UPI0036BE4124
MRYTNVGWWALTSTGQAGIAKFPVWESEEQEDGSTKVTFLFTHAQEFSACKPIMQLLGFGGGGDVNVAKDAKHLRVSATYPDYMGEPEAIH